MDNRPLVSICVISYNSSNTILETLDSINSQTYDLIELIISDDASTDNTIQICEQWIANNKTRFINSTLLTVKKNTGVPSNANRAVKASHGEWIKIIAADDILINDGIESFINQYTGNELIVACQIQTFSVDNNGKKIFRSILPPLSNVYKYQKSVTEQYRELLIYNFISAPSIIFNKEIFEKVGLFDESYKLMEDYPFWIKSTSLGFRISYLPILLTYYRLGTCTSISTQQEKFFNEKFYYEELRLTKEKRNRNIPFWEIRYWDNYYNTRIRFYVCVKILKNEMSNTNRFIYKMIYYSSIFNTLSSIKEYIRKYKT